MHTVSRYLGDRPARPPFAEQADVARIGAYRGYGGILSVFADASGAREECIGHAVSGEPIFAFAVGPAGARRASVVLAGIHAMEWIGVEVGLAIARALLDRPPSDRRVLIVPVLNVDGYRDTEEDLRAGRRRYRRTNRNGVDLNRNWPTHFRSFHLPGLLPWLGRAGPRARSEPEVDAVCSWLERHVAAGLQLDRALSLHSIGRKLLLPFGGVWRPPPSLGEHRAVAQAIAAQLPERYRAVQCSHWVPGAFARGMELDHLHLHFGALALLVECTLGGFRLTDPSSWFDPFRWYNPPDPAAHVAHLAPPLEAFVRGSEVGAGRAGDDPVGDR